jgi:hypothetical protein
MLCITFIYSTPTHITHTQLCGALRAAGCVNQRSIQYAEVGKAGLTLCRSYLKPYCMGRKTVFFSAGI